LTSLTSPRADRCARPRRLDGERAVRPRGLWPRPVRGSFHTRTAVLATAPGLFLTFLGEPTMLRLIEDFRLQVDVGPEPARTTEDTITSAADAPAMAAAFEDLLLEIDRLRSVSERIETLADRHPGMEDGLVSVAGNIRSIATVLDVFTLIRSKAGDSREEAPIPETNRYLN